MFNFQKIAFVKHFTKTIMEGVDNYCTVAKKTKSVVRAIDKCADVVLLVGTNKEFRNQVEESAMMLGDLLYDEGMKIKEKFVEIESLESKMSEAEKAFQEAAKELKSA